MHTSERIVNIKDLEDIISRAYQISQILSQELCVSSINASKAKALSESLAKELNDAKNFEICVMKTESICADEQNEVDREAVSSEKKDFHNNGLHWLKIDNGIYLDGERLRGVLEYGVSQQEGDEHATLTLKMDVVILKYGQKQKCGEI